MSDKKHYIYEHWRPDKNICFYVGLGHGRRCNVMYSRDPHHANIQKKLAKNGQRVEVRIVVSGLTRDEALTREIERIAYWKALGIKLVNRTDGGDGGGINPCAATRELMRQRKLGTKHSEEHKAKIAKGSREALARPEVNARLRAALKKANSTPEAKARASKHFKNLVRTPEHCAKISNAMTGRKLSPEHAEKSRKASLGRKQCPEEIERRRSANTGKKRSPEFCQKMRELQMRPDILAANSLRMKEINSRPDIKEANRLRLIERNRDGAGKKKGPYRKKIKDVIDVTSDTVH